jgi:hypothetical protein
MLSNRINSNGVETIDDVNHPFVRLPNANTATMFQGWGPRI